MSELMNAEALLDAILDSWDRNHTITVNLLRAVPHDAFDLRAADGSPTIAGLFAHMHYCRLVFVHEDAPEHARPVPTAEWRTVANAATLEAALHDSAAAMRAAVRGRILENRQFDAHYDHPLLMLQHFIWHEGYHQGQIKIALKQAGKAFDDEAIGPLTWDVWMDKAEDHTRRLASLGLSPQPPRE